MNGTTLNYIEDGGANCFRELRRLIRRLLEFTCTAWYLWGHTPIG